MVRPGRDADPRDRAATGDRLAALGLQTAPPGWVPRQPAESMPVAPPATVVEPVSAPPDVAVSGSHPTVGGLTRAWLTDRLPPWAGAVLDQVRLGSLLTGLAAIVAIVIAGVILLHHGSSGNGYSSSYDSSAAGSYSSDPATSSVPSAPAAATSIVVDVGGRVHKPGLVTLPAGARVADAIAAAGGPLHHREIATLDLAARVSDGQLLLIGIGPSVAGDSSDDSNSADESGAAAPVSLSTATIDDLETLPGVGPVTAQKIIAWRTAHNGFTTVAQLEQVSGIGPAKYAELSPLVTP
ncbi:MAG TPA: helix-hairpin-helix domain-containing protein [Mycobacteriales bacterium]|jgi:competence protein ComEA|nr:helix-hairpin-helix domain-containing protein [Mycobacteriales bacterium]